MKNSKNMDRIREIIRNEDKKNPLTDMQISKQMNVARSDVVKLRRLLHIGDSRRRREKLLRSAINKIIEEQPDISIRSLTLRLNEDGYDISRNIVSKFITSKKDKKLRKEKSNSEGSSAFDSMIGSRGSLKPQIELAKAAILYPKNGLHTLIHGPSGVGKSEIAECMYKFAVESGVKPKDAPFIVFNCADYAENPQLLLSQLFGYVKGAYTGAETSKRGLVEKANNGILFLDEVHRLPSEGQEILFHLIDKGKFRMLGETDGYREANILIITATTEDIESYLLSTFRRRIPVLIDLPSLSKRPMGERFRIIKNFFRQESTRMNVSINISYNVIVALLFYEANGNIGQLRSDIQVACAKGFLKNIIKKEKKIRIEVTELSSSVVKGLLKIHQYRRELEKLIIGDIEISPGDEKINQIAKEATYMFPKEIYEKIQEKYERMEKKGLDAEIINKIIGDELESKIYDSIKQVKKNKYKFIKQDLEKIVGNRIIETVEKMMEEIKKTNKDIDETLFYCLATHLSASYESLLNNKIIHNPQLDKIKTKYQKEYELAKKMMKIASDYLDIEFPEDEIAFIAMYIKSCSTNVALNENYVGIVVLTHGHVAEGMVNVANRLLGTNHAKPLEMPLDEAPNISLERAMDIVKEANMGRGVLLLADMGSLVGFGRIISERLSIITRTITRVDTLMVIEAVRKALLPDADLHEIADSLENKGINRGIETRKISTKHSNAIISICLTGRGTAEIIKKKIQEYLYRQEIEIEIITLGALSEYNFQSIIKNISTRKNILAIVGTINPGIQEIPYIDIKEILNGDGLKKIDTFIHGFSSLDKAESNILSDKLIVPELTILNANYKSRNEIIEELSKKMVEYGYVTEKFEASVFEREMLGSTLFKDNVAIPHGDPEHIIKPIIAIATLKSFVEWSEGERVNCVFMLALNQYYKVGFKKIYQMINKKDILEKIKNCKVFDELKGVLVDE